MKIPLAILLSLICFFVQAQKDIFFDGKKAILVNGSQAAVYKASSADDSYLKILNKQFVPNNKKLIDVSNAQNDVWIKMNLVNRSVDSVIILQLLKTDLREAKLVYLLDSEYHVQVSGTKYPVSSRPFVHQTSVFKILIAPGTNKTIYLSVRGNFQKLLPIYIGNEQQIYGKIYRDDLIFMFYLGIILAMLFYNLFIYFTVMDKSYLYYVFYIFAVGFAQICLDGFGYRFFWSGNAFLSDLFIVIAGALSGVGVALFFKEFLKINQTLPKFNYVIYFIIIADTIAVLLALWGNFGIAYSIIDFIALVGCIALLIGGLYLAVKGNRPAKFFIAAWSIFLTSVVIFVLKGFGVVPINLFTNSILLIGSAAELILLSFSLADQINIFKKEKEKSQQEAIEALKENERIIKEQNIILEKKVNERTHELIESNHQLSDTLTKLQEAQIQLVQSEKMASLGQLTAGIAHEINNPINFVKANVSPIKLDIDDLYKIIDAYEELHELPFEKMPEKLTSINKLKQQLDLDYLKDEINTLLKGIDEGAERTTEIVRGLRNFSRLDESEIKTVDVNEGIHSTLVILKSSIPDYIKVVTHFNLEKKLECLPGKLNQVFMNILNNAVQAIKEKHNKNEEEIIEITTEQLDDRYAKINIADSGSGMDKDTLKKIFDPFFTTKEVGEGTGLGLAIVFKIIQRHNGKINVSSEPGVGTRFEITLPFEIPSLNKTDGPI